MRLETIINLLPQTLLKFASVGVLATLVHLSVFFLCKTIAINVLAANFIAWLFAVFISYIGHKNWTFSATTPNANLKTQFKFVINSLLSLAFNSCFTYVFTTLYPSNLLTTISIIFFTPLISFLVMKYWVFIAQH